MNVIAMIPARLEASRFPRKLLQELGGKTVIVRTYEAARNTDLFDEVYVVTDSQLIFDEVVSSGGKAIMSIEEHQSGSDRIAEAIQDIDADIVVNVQGDEPFTDATSLRDLLSVFVDDIDGKIDIVSLMFKMDDEDEINNPNNVKVVTDVNDCAMYFSRSVIPFSRDNQRVNSSQSTTDYYKHIGIYAFRKEALLRGTSLPISNIEQTEKLEQLRFLANGMKIRMVKTTQQPIGIDTPEDLEKARDLLRK